MTVGVGSDRFRRKLLGSAALIFVALMARHVAAHAAWLGVAYLVYYLLWLWLPARLRTWPVNLILGAFALTALAVASRHAGLTALTTNLVYPTAVFLASTTAPTAWVWVSALLLLSARAFIAWPEPATIFNSLLNAGAIFAATYLFRLRNRARELDRQRTAELHQAYQSLQTAHQQLVDATTAIAESRAREERLRIAADIHDGVGHRLTSLIVGLESLQFMLTDDWKTAQGHLPALLSTAREALAEVREAMHARESEDIRLDREAFETLITSAARDGRLTADMEWDAHPDAWAPAVRIALYRIVQESLTNVLRHAREASRVKIRVEDRDGRIHLTVSDNGITLDPVAPGFGIRHMQSRCEALGGTLVWKTAKPAGFIVTAVVPLEGGSS